MIMNTSNSDSSCVVLESDVSVIDLDVSAEQNTEEKLAECEDNKLNASILKISFKDSATYGELNNLIAKCVKNALFYFQKNVICTEDTTSFTLTFNELSSADNDLFIVDSVPAPEIANVVPEYEVIISDRAVDQTKSDPDIAPKTAPNTCFNCDGNHSIKDCMKPKDLAKIKQNRAKFSNNKVSYERYHVDVEQKFGHLVPGELSKDLRNALGLRSKELPIHIYRMRVLGYPPGWLEHAKVSGSGLSMFDSEGKDTGATENNNDEDKYDLKKIISFPGFNVEPPHGTRDDSRAYRAPPMQHHQSKAVMIEQFRSKSTKAYKRKAIRNTTDVTVLEPTDMDIDDESDDDDLTNMPLGERLAQLETNSSIPADVPSESHNEADSPASPTPLPSEEQSPLSDGEIVDNEQSRPDSPSLDDLNERKKRLLNALDDSAVSLTTLTKKPLDDDSLIDDILALDSTLDSSATINDENGDTSAVTDSQSTIGEPSPVTPILIDSVSRSVLHVSKETVCGTPVINGVSPFSNLPNSEKWRVGVSDVLDFENLPESVGKYEKMRTLLENVRVKVKKIQYDDEDR